MSDFEYHWHRKEANFGPVIETEVAGGTHFTIESILKFDGKYVALRRPGAIPHHEIPQRVGKPLLYFVHDLPIWGESLKQYVERIVREQSGVGVKSFRVVDLTMNTYEDSQQWALTPHLIVELDKLPLPGTYGNEVTEVVTFTKDTVPGEFGWWGKKELEDFLKEHDL
jgi:hypothetical protein